MAAAKHSGNMAHLVKTDMQQASASALTTYNALARAIVIMIVVMSSYINVTRIATAAAAICSVRAGVA